MRNLTVRECDTLIAGLDCLKQQEFNATFNASVKEIDDLKNLLATQKELVKMKIRRKQSGL